MGKPGVLCVDDNPAVTDALRVKLGRSNEFEWRGSLHSADDLLDRCERERPAIVLLDVDMPGKDPFEALAELTARAPDIIVLIFTGHVRKDLIERALDCGAWGYVSKNDGEDELLAAMKRAANEELALSPEAQRTYDS